MAKANKNLSKKNAARKTAGNANGYMRRITVRAPCERVFDALTTPAGLRGWWTTRVSGSAISGGEVRFEFAGLDEYIVMHVDRATYPSAVRWTCMAHTGLSEWDGTTLMFDLVANASDTCELNFQHVGLTLQLDCYDDCKLGWEYFLASLAAYVEQGQGTPFGAS